MMTFVMTVSRKRALRAVEAGLVKRRYSKDGNTMMRCMGAHSRTLWALLNHKLIEDGPLRGGNVVTMVLTPEGKAVLHER